MSSPPYLALMGLAKSFGATAVLSDLTLDIPKGEIFALLGPSGSGKTTALRLLAGFESPDRGAIRVDGEDVTTKPPAARRFGMVFQHYALFPHLSVGENVAFGLRGGKAETARRVAEALALVELGGFADRPVTALSGGQQQRVALARALAPEPRVLLLDEPLSNLDPTLRERTRRALAGVVRKVGITTVLVTHEQEEAFDLGDRVGVLHQGRLQQVGTPEELYQRPAGRFVASFVGRMSFLPGVFTVRDGQPGVRLAAGDLTWPGRVEGVLQEGEEAELAVRPESLALVPPGTAGALPGRIADRRYTGLTTYYAVAVADSPKGAQESGQEIELAAPGAAMPQVGEAVAVALAPGGPPPTVFPRRPA